MPSDKRYQLVTSAGEGALAGSLSGPVDGATRVLATILGVHAQDLQRRVPEVERGAEPAGKQACQWRSGLGRDCLSKHVLEFIGLPNSGG